ANRPPVRVDDGRRRRATAGHCMLVRAPGHPRSGACGPELPEDPIQVLPPDAHGAVAKARHGESTGADPAPDTDAADPEQLRRLGVVVVVSLAVGLDPSDGFCPGRVSHGLHTVQSVMPVWSLGNAPSVRRPPSMNRSRARWSNRGLLAARRRRATRGGPPPSRHAPGEYLERPAGARQLA